MYCQLKHYPRIGVISDENASSLPNRATTPFMPTSTAVDTSVAIENSCSSAATASESTQSTSASTSELQQILDLEKKLVLQRIHRIRDHGTAVLEVIRHTKKSAYQTLARSLASNMGLTDKMILTYFNVSLSFCLSISRSLFLESHFTYSGL
jgi:hypothetical protein